MTAASAPDNAASRLSDIFPARFPEGVATGRVRVETDHVGAEPDEITSVAQADGAEAEDGDDGQNSETVGYDTIVRL
jgi:hypothetical protein